MENVTVFFIVAIIMKTSLVLDGRPMGGGTVDVRDEGHAKYYPENEIIDTAQQKSEEKQPSCKCPYCERGAVDASDEGHAKYYPENELIDTAEQKSQAKKSECPYCKMCNYALMRKLIGTAEQKSEENKSTELISTTGQKTEGKKLSVDPYESKGIALCECGMYNHFSEKGCLREGCNKRNVWYDPNSLA